MKPHISLCMIVKDEAAMLPRCLASVNGIVDETVIVDTGSCDNTVDIAASFGARLLHHPWEGNFSIPRNISLENARGNWVLILDADEMIDPAHRSAIKNATCNEDIPGYRLLIQLHPDWTEMRSVRLFKNTHFLRFRGIFHEELTVPDDLHEKFVSTDIRIIHNPWTIEESKKKYDRNKPLLRKHLVAYPDDVYQMLDLIRIYLETKELTEAGQLLLNVKSILFSKLQGNRKYKFYLAYYYLYTLKLLAVQDGDIKKRLAICEEALGELPLCPSFTNEAAHLCYKLQEYDRAIEYFFRCLEFGRTHNFDQCIMFQKDILGPGALSGLGYSFFRKRDHYKAAEYFEQSLSIKEDAKVRSMLHALRFQSIQKSNSR